MNKEFPYVIKETNECKESCFYYDLKSENCSLVPDKNLIFDELKKRIIKTCPSNANESLIIVTNDSYAFQITNSYNELKALNGLYSNEYNLSMIDITECENLMKEKGYLNEDQNLIILKCEKITNISNEKKVQYEIYHPESKLKMDLSVCSNLKVDIYIPSAINESILYKYNASSGYYNDLCCPYTTEQNTDIILEDRRDEYVNNNMSLCEKNCIYSGYNTQTKNVQCKCDAKITFRLIIDIEIDKDHLYNQFTQLEKLTNFYVVKCYKLLFCKEGIIHNIGNFVILSIILINIVLVIVFVVKGHKEIIKNIQKINIDTSNDNKISNDIKTQSNEKKISKTNKNINKKTKRFSCMNLKSNCLNTSNKNNIKIKENKKGEKISPKPKSNKKINNPPIKNKEQKNISGSSKSVINSRKSIIKNKKSVVKSRKSVFFNNLKTSEDTTNTNKIYSSSSKPLHKASRRKSLFNN